MAMMMIPLMIAGGFDGVEPLKEAKVEDGSYRALARELGRSPSHICRVMHGERKSARLECRMRELGFEPATLRAALKPGEMAKEGI